MSRMLRDLKDGINNTEKILNFAGRVAGNASAGISKAVMKHGPKLAFGAAKGIAYDAPKALIHGAGNASGHLGKNIDKFFEEPWLVESRASLQKSRAGFASIGQSGAKITKSKLEGFGKGLWHGGAAVMHSPIGKVVKTGGLSAGLYGLMAYGMDDPSRATGDRIASAGKYMTAAAIDTASDLTLTAVAGGLSMLGPVGVAAAAGITAYNVIGNFVGIDAGSLALRAMDAMDERYEADRNGGKKFQLGENSSMALQRQISNIHQSGSNMAEMMHN
jgi:hypothetical protein